MTAHTSAAPTRQSLRAGADPDAHLRTNPKKVALGIVGMIAVVWGLANLFLAFGYYPEKFGSKFVIAILAIVGGVGGAALLFYFLNMFVEGLPRRLSEGVIPYAFILPGLLLLGHMLIYPTFQTSNFSYSNADSTAHVGFQNYSSFFSSSEFWQSIV